MSNSPPSSVAERHDSAPGFYDGAGTYRLRFSPPQQGQWTYKTSSTAKNLDAKAGGFTAIKPTGANHGPVKVFKTFHFAYADGTPFLPGRHHLLRMDPSDRRSCRSRR